MTLSDEEKELIHDYRLEEILETIDLDEICWKIAHYNRNFLSSVAREELIEFANTIWEKK